MAAPTRPTDPAGQASKRCHRRWHSSAEQGSRRFGTGRFRLQKLRFCKSSAGDRAGHSSVGRVRPAAKVSKHRPPDHSSVGRVRAPGPAGFTRPTDERAVGAVRSGWVRRTNEAVLAASAATFGGAPKVSNAGVEVWALQIFARFLFRKAKGRMTKSLIWSRRYTSLASCFYRPPAWATLSHPNWALQTVLCCYATGRNRPYSSYGPGRAGDRCKSVAFASTYDDFVIMGA